MMGLSKVDMIEVPRVNTCDVILPTGIVLCITHTVYTHTEGRQTH